MRTAERTPVRRELLRQRAAGLGSGSDDTLLAAWLRHYATVIVLFVVGAVVLALAWGAFALPKAEYWSIVIDRKGDLPVRQLGVVAETLFRADATYRAALPETGLSDPSQLYGMVRLQAVPESRVLIVAARSNDTQTAKLAADAMAHALSAAFRKASQPGFVVLGAPQPAPISSAIATPVLALLGTLVGLLLGIGVSILTYRAKRPVIAMRRAAEFVRPGTVIIAPGRRRWLGALRVHPPGLAPTGAAVVGAELRAQRAERRIVPPGVEGSRRDALVRDLDLIDVDEGAPLIVCDPKTREDDLLRTMLGIAEDEDPPLLLWLE